MLYLASKLFEQEKSENLRKRLFLSPNWVDGTVSAKHSTIKKNLQLGTSEENTIITNEVIESIRNDSLIKSYTFPNKIFNILFSRTGVGMYYGAHLDTPYVPNGRRDLSFTIFLNKPEEYSGGELILYIPPERKKIKLKQGEIVIYPTKYLHEVKEVTDGERMVCVGWIESQIESNDERENLYLMRSSLLQIIEKYGHSSATQNLKICFNNFHKRFSS